MPSDAIQNARRARARRAFSLFELMLVTGLVAAFALALLPVLSNARETAMSSVCKVRLHDLAVVCQNYAMNVGHFPWGMIEPSRHTFNYWKTDAHRLIYPHENPERHGVTNWNQYASFCWDFRRLTEDETAWLCGEMFDGVRADSVMCCPKCVRAKTDNWDGNRMTGYNYNVCFLGYVENDAGKRKYPTPYSSVRCPERVVVFGDGGYAGGPNKFMRAPKQDKYYDNSSASLRKGGTQAFRHGRGAARHCNMAFLDGHVEEFHQPYKAGGSPGWVDEKSHTAFIGSGNGIYGPRGFGETDNDEPRDGR